MRTSTIGKLGKIVALSALLAAIGFALVAVATPVASADEAPQPLSGALGKSVGELFEMWSIWSSPYGGGPDHHGYVQFMPLPNPDCEQHKKKDPWYCTGELDASLTTDEGFFLPVNGYVGWEYLDGSEDPLLPDWAFVDVDVTVTLDDETFFDSDDLDLTDFYAEQYYSNPLYVDEEAEGYTADIFAQGVGFVCPPLSAGTHVLHLVEDAPAWNVICDNTWTITVTAD